MKAFVLIASATALLFIGAARLRHSSQVLIAAMSGAALVALYSASYLLLMVMGLQPSFALASVLLLDRIPYGGFFVLVGYALEVAAAGAFMRLVFARFAKRQ